MSAAAVRDGGSRDAATILARPDIAARHAAGAVILAGRGEPLRLTFASGAAAATFRAASLARLEAVLLSPGQPAGTRLAALARTIEADRPPRLERLRFFVNGRARMLEFECRAVGRVPGDTLFVAVARSSHRMQPGVDLVAPSDVSRSTPESSDAAAPAKLVRFVWKIGPGHIVERISSEFADTVGHDNVLEPGMSLVDRLRDLGSDPRGQLRDALASQVTFSGLDLSWPTEGRGPIAVVLAGQPIFGGARRLQGFRGFGMIRSDRTTGSPPQSSGTIIDRQLQLDELPVHQDKPTGPPSEPTQTQHSQELPVGPADQTGSPADQNSSIAPDGTTPITDKPDAPPIVSPPPHAAEPHAERADDRATSRGSNIVPLRSVDEKADGGLGRTVPPALSTSENDAFDELANLLQARLTDTSAEAAGLPPTEPVPASPPGDPLSSAPTASAGADPDFAALVERLPIGVLVARDGIGLYANRTFLDLLGYADLDAFQRAGGLDRTLRGRDAGKHDDPDASSAIALATADGEILEVDGNLKPVVWAGLPATLLAIRRSVEVEIAHRLGPLREELAAREKEAAELDATLDAATDGVAVLDSAGHIVSLNRSAEALFGVELSDVVRESFTTLLAPESHATARDYLDGLKRSGVASVLNDGREVVARAGMRGVIPLFMTIGPLRHEGEPRFCVVLRDLTPWKRAERDLQEARDAAERASQLKSDFLARVSHEVRTPLNAILGFAEVMMGERFGPVGNERYKEYLRDIHASGIHVMNIVNDLLDLSKIEAGKMELTFASVDANKVVAECVSLMQPQAYRERVVIRMALSPRLPNIVADDRSLRQIILNILSNAVNFNEPGGQVIVSTALTDTGAAVLRVRDTGVGMNESDIEAALEPFRQLPTARKGTGTGLGLPLTKALADANRASFTIKSKKNEGTLVEIAFPSARVLSG